MTTNLIPFWDQKMAPATSKTLCNGTDRKNRTKVQETLLILIKVPCFTTGDITEIDFPSWPERYTIILQKHTTSIWKRFIKSGC